MSSPTCQNFLHLLREKILCGEFIALKASKPKASELIEANFAQYSGESRISGVYSYKTQSITKHYSIDELLEQLTKILGHELFCATIFSTSEDIALDHNRRGEPSLTKRRASKVKQELSHNKVRSYLIPETAQFLRALKISSSDGIRPAMAHKFRQINKFVEIFDSTIRSAGLLDEKHLKICDLGAGKSYLTFAIDFHLRENLAMAPEIVAIERRKELIDECKSAAAEVNSPIIFRHGDISDFKNGSDSFDVLVALHACDTATDDAIALAAAAKARAILLAPCCQKWLRNHQQLVSNSAAFLRDGIVAERHLSMLTDLIRAAALEGLGYSAKIFEFIGSEDTDKNIMISGIRGEKPRPASVRASELTGLVDFRSYYLFQRAL